MTSAETPTHEETYRILEDDEECGGCNGGTCVSPIDTEGALSSKRPSCQCKNTGHIGVHCEIPCSKTCENGGKCIPAQESTDGKETCSCTKAVVDGNPFAGLVCEYGATKSCMTLGSVSKHSFCTNGGDCVDIVGDNEVHKDCICTDGFEGSHCEYKSGTLPTFIANAKSASVDGSSPALLSNFTLFSAMAGVCMLIIFVMFLFVVRARKRHAEATKKERELQRATAELTMVQLDVDDDSSRGRSSSSKPVRLGFI